MAPTVDILLLDPTLPHPGLPSRSLPMCIPFAILTLWGGDDKLFDKGLLLKLFRSTPRLGTAVLFCLTLPDIGVWLRICELAVLFVIVDDPLLDSNFDKF